MKFNKIKIYIRERYILYIDYIYRVRTSKKKKFFFFPFNFNLNKIV